MATSTGASTNVDYHAWGRGGDLLRIIPLVWMFWMATLFWRR